jgi:outer membrane protein assembly factor BamB
MDTNTTVPGQNSTGRGIRWWPCWSILGIGIAVVAGLQLLGDAPFQTRNLRSLTAVLVVAVLLVLWWLLLSRAPWKLRLFGFLGACVLGASPALFFRIRGVSGDLVPILEPRWSHPGAAGPQAASGGATRPTEVELDARFFPEFQGPGRSGFLTGPTLARDWRQSPPQILWKQPIGAAWSGFAVLGGRAVTQEQRGEEELVTCYDLATGRRLWEHADASRYATTIAGEGPRATPAIVRRLVFTLGANGHLNCLKLETGERVWGRDLCKDLGASVPGWGFASSPLVYDGRVVVSAGGKPNRSLVAYRVADGALDWAAGERPVNYSSPTILNMMGGAQVLMFNSQKITAHNPLSGAVIWEYPWGIGQPHVALPVPVSSNRVVFSSGYGVGAELIELETSTNGTFAARRVWKSIRLKSKFANFFHRDGFLYGLDDGILVCVDVKDGSLKWKEGRYGHGQMLWVRDVLLVMAESGEVVLLAPDAERPNELARFRVFGGKTWNPPALCNDLLLIRNDLEAACVRLPTVSPPVDTTRMPH